MTLTQISTAGVKDDAVTSGKIPANAVGSSELADNAVDTAAIANSAVTNAKIADGNISTLKISDDAVTVAKIQNFSQNQIAGRVASGTGNLQALSASDVRTMINVADGANQTTINNQASDRIVTATGTTNTLNAESAVLIDGSGRIQQGSDTSNLGQAKLNIVTGGEDGISLGKNQGATVSDGDVLGTLAFQTAIGSQTTNSAEASIKGIADEDSSGSTAATNLAFFTKPTGTGPGSSPTEGMRLASNGQLLVGTTAPSAYNNRQFAVGDVGDTSSFVEIRTGNTGVGHLLFSRTAGANSGNYQGYIAYHQPTDHFSFHTGGGNQRARIDSDGLKFNNDSAAANALYDYEEGTWTPAFFASNGSAASTNIYHASYTKVGNQVFISCYIGAGSNSNTNGLWMVSGLPFTSKSSNHYFSIAVGYWNSLSGNINHLTGTVQPNDTNVLIRGTTSATSATTNLSYSSFVGNGSEFLFSATYLVP